MKSGESWFGRPELDEDGAITGWWFYDADDKHFKYWIEHNVPHILVLHDLDTGTSYWVHITSDRVVSTGKGSKILIPNTNVLDADHLDALMQVALGDRGPAPWEGSAWLGGPAILGPDRIRYALMAPRLIAPHPNLAVSAYEPEEAVAVLMKMRLTELRPSKPRYFETNAPDHAACRDSDDWRWRFYAALYEYVVDGGDVNALHELALHKAASPAQHAAAACVLAAILIEAHMPDEAMAVVDEELKADECGPIDHAWLSMHRARCLAELGHIEEAVAQAIQVQSLRRTHPGDPTAMAVVGAAADLVFTLSGWGEKPIADAVTGRDTLAAWWRTQEVAWGLQFKANEDFKEWAQDTTVSWGKSDRVVRR